MEVYLCWSGLSQQSLDLPSRRQPHPAAPPCPVSAGHWHRAAKNAGLCREAPAKLLYSPPFALVAANPHLGIAGHKHLLPVRQQQSCSCGSPAPAIHQAVITTVNTAFVNS